MPTVPAAIALGSNLGPREAHLAAALAALAALPRTAVVACSPKIETLPVGPVKQGAYLNAAVKMMTSLSPRELLEFLLAIERARGRDRVREVRWGPRTLDLDLLLYGECIIDEPGLTVPHPRLHERRFVLEPLAHIWPDARVPGRSASVAQLLAGLPSSGPPCAVPSGQ